MGLGWDGDGDGMGWGQQAQEEEGAGSFLGAVTIANSWSFPQVAGNCA